jgi:hypothetical protein
VATGLAVVAVLASGCSEPQQASETLPSAAETSESPGPEPLGPPDFPMPDEAREQTEAGAEAFLRYYLELYNYAKDRLDPTHLSELSQGCITCDDLVRQISEDAAAGYAYVGGDITIESMSPPLIRDSRAEIALVIVEAPLQITHEGAPVPDLTFPERRKPSSGAVLNWSTTHSSWIINQLDAG